MTLEEENKELKATLKEVESLLGALIQYDAWMVKTFKRVNKLLYPDGKWPDPVKRKEYSDRFQAEKTKNEKLQETVDTLKGYMKNAVSPIYNCHECGARDQTFRSVIDCYKCGKPYNFGKEASGIQEDTKTD